MESNDQLSFYLRLICYILIRFDSNRLKTTRVYVCVRWNRNIVAFILFIFLEI